VHVMAERWVLKPVSSHWWWAQSGDNTLTNTIHSSSQLLNYLVTVSISH
jgi:hypothetical protein